MHQLEVSFLSNIYTNFDPLEFDERFNKCLLNTLKQNLTKKGTYNADAFALRVTFCNKLNDEIDFKETESNNIILNMEQVGYTHSKNSSNGTLFARNIRRLKDGRNCLDTVSRKSNDFIIVKFVYKY